MEYPSVGYFNAEYFDPSRWRPSYPNPAFLRMTLRDAYWGAKIVTSFTDADIEAIVHTGKYTDPRAERYVADVLKARRDIIGQYFFSQVNPLDRFALVETNSGEQALTFENLALARNYAPSPTLSYRYSIRRYVPYGFDPAIVQEATSQTPRIILDRSFLSAWAERTASARTLPEPPSMAYVQLETSYDGGAHWSNSVSVYLQYDERTGRFSLVAIDRET